MGPVRADRFLKPNTSVTGPDSPIVLPAWSDEVHYEAELAVVIKSVAKDLDPADAPRVILGYAVANDVSARDRQRGDATWTRAKAFDTSCPLGPWIEMPEPGADTAFDPGDAVVRARVDGAVVQEGSTGDMIKSVPELISYVSSIFALLPGDVILTGTPAGVGEIRAGQRRRGRGRRHRLLLQPRHAPMSRFSPALRESLRPGAGRSGRRCPGSWPG